MKKTFSLGLIISWLCCFNAWGQTIVNTDMKSIFIAAENIRQHLPVEKLYMQLDKPYYNLGDTLRFKSYLLNADFFTPSTRSGLLYVELDDAANRMVKQMMVPVTLGVSWGDIVLDEKEIPQGSYTLRAYTNWMRNFGEDYIFKREIYISAVNGSVLVKADFKLDSIAGKNKVQANLRFTSMDKNPIRLKELQLRVMNGRRTLIKDKLGTGMDGSMKLSFDLADKTTLTNLFIQAQQTGKDADTAVLTIPVSINRPEHMDLQFMPEGGNLVAGISSMVGFKAIGEDGKGLPVNGKIYNSHQQEIAKLQSRHKGMGSFGLTPQAGESYTAAVTLPNGAIKNYSLPAIKASGTSLSVAALGSDSLQLTVTISTDLLSAQATYYLIGQARGVICYASSIAFKKISLKWVVATGLFPTGIARFTLLNATHQPLNERVVYISHQDNMQISLAQNKPVYALRDSVALNMQVNDKDGKPLQGTFSVAVTDDDQVKTDGTGSNIINDLLFTSDLKGTVEDPGWYLENNTPERLTALDDLLLTQGWVGYDWKQMFNAVTQPKFAPEKQFTVQGKVTNIFNKPVKKARISLFQKQPLLTMDAVTDNNGRFTFKDSTLFPVDPAYYLVQVKNKDGEFKSFVGINVDEFTQPVFALSKEHLLPWYVNSDTTLLNNTSTKRTQLKNEANYKGEGHLLKEVTIKETKVIPNSHNLNDSGGADITLDEKDMNAAKKMTLYELLAHKFKYFYKQPLLGNRPPSYHLNMHKVVFVIDGVFIQRFGLPVDLYMDYLTAEDIKGIEIMSSAKYAIAYDPDFIHKEILLRETEVPVYLEITTYSGHGAFISNASGRYEYKPIPFTFPKQFYSPKYSVKNNTIAMGTDLRSTIHWEPNIITDKDGKATISFFTADKPANYTIIIEGSDLNGNIGYKRQRIKVDSKFTAAK
jgi:hypothetical protein